MRDTNRGQRMANADGIRTMTDEELAEWLSNITIVCPNGGADCKPTCKECWLDWLKQEVDDG